MGELFLLRMDYRDDRNLLADLSVRPPIRSIDHRGRGPVLPFPLISGDNNMEMP